MSSTAHDLPPLRVRHRSVLPIVQGGMGVGISAHRLAGSVARAGAVGTIACVDLRREAGGHRRVHERGRPAGARPATIAV